MPFETSTQTVITERIYKADNTLSAGNKIIDKLNTLVASNPPAGSDLGKLKSALNTACPANKEIDVTVGVFVKDVRDV